MGLANTNGGRSSSYGPFRDPGRRPIAPTLNTIENCLAQVGLDPEQIDYISYDHLLHTQDLRKWPGSKMSGNERPAFFPNAKLLVMRQEWESASAKTKSTTSRAKSKSKSIRRAA